MSEFLYVLSLSVKNQVVSFHRNIIQHLSCMQQATKVLQPTRKNPWEETTLATSKQYQQITPHWVFPSPSVHPPQTWEKITFRRLFHSKTLAKVMGSTGFFLFFF